MIILIFWPCGLGLNPKMDLKPLGKSTEPKIWLQTEVETSAVSTLLNWAVWWFSRNPGFVLALKENISIIRFHFVHTLWTITWETKCAFVWQKRSWRGWTRVQKVEEYHLKVKVCKVLFWLIALCPVQIKMLFFLWILFTYFKENFTISDWRNLL